MRILLVGAGGVGDAFARIAARRSFFEALVVTDYDAAARGADGRRGAGAPPRARHAWFLADRVDASDAGAVADAVRRHGATHVMNAVDPRFVMPIFEGARAGRRGLPRHGDVALAAAPRAAPYAADRRQARRRAAGAGRRGGGPRAGSPWSASGSSPGSPTCSPGTPSTTCSRHVTELGVRDGANLTVAGYDFAPGLLDLDHDRGVPQPAGGLRARPRLVHDPAFQRARGLRLPPAASARSSACTSSTRRSSSCPAGWTSDKVTFKYGLGHRVHRRAQGAAQGGPRQDRTRCQRQGGRWCRPATWWPPACRTPPALGDAMSGARRAPGCS